MQNVKLEDILLDVFVSLVIQAMPKPHALYVSEAIYFYKRSSARLFSLILHDFSTIMHVYFS